MKSRIEEEKIRESFEKVKKDIGDLKEKIDMLSQSHKSLTKSQAVSVSIK